MATDRRHSRNIDQSNRAVVGQWGACQLKTAFQPIYAFDDGKLRVCAFEALTRPVLERETLDAGGFFAQLERNDLIEVEAIARKTHLENAARFLGPDATLFVNFDPRAFESADGVRALFAELEDTLDATGIKPHQVVCEITERASSAESWLRAFVGSLRRAGFRIAVDDYGAQASDARRIDQLEPDIVKFDGAWATQLMRTPAGVLLLKMLVDDFRQRSIKTLFEGLEQPRQIELAEYCGVDMAQGFALAYPQTVPADFSAYLGGEGGMDVHRRESAA